MIKKNEKRICWGCDGEVSPHLTQCLYCGQNLMEDPSLYREADPKAAGGPKGPLAEKMPSALEWERALEFASHETDEIESSRADIIALLLLFPGVVFCLFGVLILLFAQDGVLTIQWDQAVASLFFLAGSPLIYLGWRWMKRRSG